MVQHDWRSVAELSASLGLEHLAHDRDALRSAVRQEAASLHPDRNGGAFKNAEAETRYKLLTNALSFIDNPPQTSLVRLEELPGLVATLREVLDESPRQVLSEARAEYRVAAARDTRTRYSTIRVGSGTFAAICAGLIAFSTQLKDNPLFSWLLQDVTLFMPAAFMLLVMSGGFFAFTWYLERRAEARSEWLATEEGQRELLTRILRGRVRAPGEGATFTLRDMIDATIGRRRSGPLTNMLGGIVPYGTAEKLARVHIADLEQRGIILRLSRKSFDLMFEVDKDLAKELLGRDSDYAT